MSTSTPVQPPLQPPLQASSGMRSASSKLAIDATGLTKTYGKGKKVVQALSEVNLQVEAGIIFGLLGPNGAGKSTTVKILTTLSRPDHGHAEVAGIDILRKPQEVRRAIGYVSQKPAFDPVATGRENLTLQGRIYGLSASETKMRANQLLKRFSLTEAADRQASKWSGGMQRKLDVAMGLIHQPKVLFLDEPTTGLDPEARADMWQEISQLAHDDGLTVLLTTHYLEEADNLASQLAIIDRGRLVASGSPEILKNELKGDTIHAELRRAQDIDRASQVIRAVTGGLEPSFEGTKLKTQVPNGAEVLPALLIELEKSSVSLASITIARPSLDDVYLRYTGRDFHTADQHSAPESVTSSQGESA